MIRQNDSSSTRCAEEDPSFPLRSMFKSLAPKANVVKLEFFGIETPREKKRP